jgi:hypothetical protein
MSMNDTGDLKMTKHFVPKREDGRTYCDVLVDFIKDKPPETVVSYAELADILGLSPDADRGIIQNTKLQANKVLLNLYQRRVVSVRGVGYRVIPAREHRAVAGSHQSKAERQMVTSVSILAGTRLEELTESERVMHRNQLMLAQSTLAGFQYLDRRINHIEQLLKGTTTINPKDEEK